MHSALNSVLGVAVASLRQLFNSLATASTDREPAIRRVGPESRCPRECVDLDARCGSDGRQFGDWRSDSVVDGLRRRGADRRHPGRDLEQTRRPVVRRRQRPEGVFFSCANSWQRNQWTHDEGATALFALTRNCESSFGSWQFSFGLSLERYRMRFERMQPLAYRCALRSRGEISSRSRMHSNFAPPQPSSLLCSHQQLNTPPGEEPPDPESACQRVSK